MLQPNDTTADDRTSDARRFSITELAGEFGVTSRTLRHYEEQGIVTPSREGQRRIYSRRDRARLKLALQGKRVGFSLAEIREMLDLYDLKDGQSSQLRFSREKFRERVAGLEDQRREIDIAITELNRICGIIGAMLGDDEMPNAQPCARERDRT